MPGARTVRPEDVQWLNERRGNTAIVIDLPGEQSVARGLQLTAQGFRPVPLFNTTWGSDTVVPVRDIIRGLRWGAEALPAKSLADDAPPAFLLDANRQTFIGPALPGKYDNRWLVFPQDFPSARTLREHGINAVVLWQKGRTASREDLAHVLLRWQEAGIAVLAHNEDGAHGPLPIIVTRPSQFRSLFHRLFALAGFKRNSAGGFGAVIPQPGSGYG